MSDPPTLLRAAQRGREGTFQHPLNPNSEIHGFELGRRVGPDSVRQAVRQRS